MVSSQQGPRLYPKQGVGGTRAGPETKASITRLNLSTQHQGSPTAQMLKLQTGQVTFPDHRANPSQSWDLIPDLPEPFPPHRASALGQASWILAVPYTQNSKAAGRWQHYATTVSRAPELRPTQTVQRKPCHQPTCFPALLGHPKRPDSTLSCPKCCRDSGSLPGPGHKGEGSQGPLGTALPLLLLLLHFLN